MNKRKRVTPHTLRHVFASELLHAGANLRQIQELRARLGFDRRIGVGTSFSWMLWVSG